MVAAICDHQVVQNSAGRIREQRVALPPLTNTDDVNGDQCFERASGIVQASRQRAHGDLPHMRNVEQAGGSTGVQMLGQYAGGVVQRHFIAGESDQPRAAFDMKFVKRRAQRWGRLIRFGHARPRWFADGAGRKRMREESGHIGAPHGGGCAAVSVPPLCVCLRTLSRRRAQRAPLSRVRQPSRSFCLRVSGAVAPSASEDRSLPRWF
jgi:hypothetical protein